MNDDFERFIRRIDELMHPFRSVQEQVDRILAIRVQANRWIHPYDSMLATLQTLDNPDLRFPQELRHPDLADTINAYLEKQSQLDAWLHPQKRLHDQLAELLGPQRTLFESFKKWLDPARLINHQLAILLDPLNDYLADLEGLSIDNGPGGSVLIDGEQVSTKEIREAAQAFESSQDAMHAFVQALLAWLSRLSPLVRRALVYILLPYLLSIFANLTTPLHQDWWRSLTNTNPRVIRKEILREASDLFAPGTLADYRFVYATQLNVRTSGSMQADVIDSVPLGKTVRVLQRKKSWTEIEYLSEANGEISGGWVHSRYLENFRR